MASASAIALKYKKAPPILKTGPFAMCLSNLEQLAHFRGDTFGGDAEMGIELICGG